jgi:hypothetical protein
MWRARHLWVFNRNRFGTKHLVNSAHKVPQTKQADIRSIVGVAVHQCKLVPRRNSADGQRTRSVRRAGSLLETALGEVLRALGGLTPTRRTGQGTGPQPQLPYAEKTLGERYRY